MAMTLEDLAAYFKELSGEKGNEEIREARAQEAASIFRDLESLTPRRTGQLSANWRPSTDPGVGYQEGMFTNPNTPQSVYEYAKNIAIDKPIYLANATPYAKFVNDGTSTMAPRAFVEAALVRSKNRNLKLDISKT